MPMPFEMDMKAAGNLVLKCLSSSRADDYGEWIAVGMALKHSNDAFFDLWVRFSEQSPKFKGRGECAAKWASFNCDGDGNGRTRTMGSIIRWAQQDNPVAFAEVMDGSLYGIILRSHAKSHTSIARVVAHLYSDRNVCVETPKRWYAFDGHRWVADTGAWNMWRLLRDDLPRVYASMAASQQRRLSEMDPDDTDARKPIVQCVARLNDIVLRLGNERFKDAMVRESALFMCHRDFVDTLDAKDNLLGFKNGVYDLDAGVFRPGSPDDRVSMSCGYDFAVEDDAEIQADIRAVVASTQATPEVTEYLWQLMAYMLHGRKYMELLWFFTGSGRNGKGTIAALLKAALGDYFYAPDVGIFTSADRSSSSAKPEITMMKGKRAVMASEPDDSDGSSFKVNKLKAWRGNDLISARALYSDVTTFRPQFGIIISMNDKPQLDKLDRAIASTLRIVDFPFEFVDVANNAGNCLLQPHQRPMDCGLKKRFDDVRYSQQFMRMLLEVYARHRDDVFLRSKPIPTPVSVLAATREYVEDNNEVGAWLAENYERTDSTRDRTRSPGITTRISRSPGTTSHNSSALIDLKDFGVDRYDRVVLWRGVHAGVSDLRALVEVPQDGVASALDLGLTRDSLPGIIRGEVAPVLKLRGVLLPGGWSVVKDNGLAPVNTSPRLMDGGGSSRQDCLRSCLADASCRFAHYAADTKMCRHHPDAGAEALGALLLDDKNGSVRQTDALGGDPALLIRPTPANATSPTATEVALKVVYDQAISSGMGAKTLRENASYLAGRLLAVLKRYRFMIDLTHPAARKALDLELEAYYGASAYGDSGDPASMSAVVDSILLRTQDLVRRARKAPPKHVAPETLVANLHAMSADEVDEYAAKLRSLRLSAIYHRDLYPMYVENITGRVARMLSMFGGVILAMGYTVYVIILVHMNRRRILSFEQLLQRSLLGMCCFVIAVVVIESMSVKLVARVEHNQRAIDDNSESLVAASIRAHEQFVKLVDLVQRMPPQQQSRQSHADDKHADDQDGQQPKPPLQIDYATLGVASALISDAKVAIAKFDMCNAITSGHPRVPKPYAEIVLYGVVGCVFVFAAAVAVYRIAPLKCVDNIRMLSSMRTRIMRGDAAAMHEASGIAACARPPVFIWSIFAWFGLLVFTVLSVFMLFASQDVVNDYKDSLDALEGCTNETGV